MSREHTLKLNHSSRSRVLVFSTRPIDAIDEAPALAIAPCPPRNVPKRSTARQHSNIRRSAGFKSRQSRSEKAQR